MSSYNWDAPPSRWKWHLFLVIILGLAGAIALAAFS
jgi:hypothetical protein